MTHLILIRHGQTNWNIEGRWQGQADPPLNERGREQARLAAEQLAHFEFAALYSSDLRRAFETAHIIGAAIGLPILTDARWREIRLGMWQGLLSTDIQARYPDEFRRWHASPLAVRPPGGEDIATLAARVIPAIGEIAARHPGQRVAIVAHELPIAVAACHAAGLGLERLREMIPPTGAWREVIVTNTRKEQSNGR